MRAGSPRATTAPSSSPREEAAAWARDVLRDRDAVVLDTELTDFTGRVIEIAVVSTDGTTLLKSLVDPEGVPINPYAQRAHGITAQMLIGSPTLERLWPRLDDVLRGKEVIAWNASFDHTRLRTEHQRITDGADLPDWLSRPWVCAMRKHAAWVGERSAKGGGFRNHRLEGGHRAEDDCKAALDWIKRMAETAHGEQAGLDGGTAGAPSHDLVSVRERWPRILDAVKGISRSTEAMLADVELLSTTDRTLTIRHHSGPINRRLAEERNLDVATKALTAALGPGWTVRVAETRAPTEKTQATD